MADIDVTMDVDWIEVHFFSEDALQYGRCNIRSLSDKDVAVNGKSSSPEFSIKQKVILILYLRITNN